MKHLPNKSSLVSKFLNNGRGGAGFYISESINKHDTCFQEKNQTCKNRNILTHVDGQKYFVCYTITDNSNKNSGDLIRWDFTCGNFVLEPVIS